MPWLFHVFVGYCCAMISLYMSLKTADPDEEVLATTKKGSKYVPVNGEWAYHV